MQYHKYNLTELENMMPYERDIYITLLIEYLRDLEKQKKMIRK